MRSCESCISVNQTGFNTDYWIYKYSGRESRLGLCKLDIVEVGVMPFLSDEFFVASGLDNLTVLHHQNSISAFDSR
jgi:hypothetical protein